MKTKLISLTWRGTASVDPRFSAAMLSWSVADICTRDTHDKLSVGIENGQLEAYNCDFEQQFGHAVKYVVGVCRVVARHAIAAGKAGKYADFAYLPARPEEPLMSIVGPQHGFVYLLKDPRDPLLHVHLFEGDNVDDMTELLHQMRDPAQTNLGGGSVGSIPSSFIAPTNNPGFRPSNATSNVSAIGIVAGGGGNQRVSHHSTPASNLKFAEAARTAQHDGSPSVVSRSGSTTASASLVGGRLAGSKSYTSGLNHSAGTVQVNTSSHSQRHSHAAMAPPSSTAAQPTPATLLDISPNNTQFFEVMYVGKIKVSHKRVPFSFIDDALPKFKAYDAQKIKTAAAASRRNSNISGTSSNADTSAARASTSAVATSTDAASASEAAAQSSVDDVSESSASGASESEGRSQPQPQQQFEEKILNTRLSEENKENSLPQIKKLLLRGQSQTVLPVQFDQTNSLPLPSPKIPATVAERNEDETDDNEEVPHRLRDRSASIGAIPVVEQNRTMVFLIGKSDMRLISPDRKQVLLYKDFKDVASCAQGHKNADHFGIICREPNTTSPEGGSGSGGGGYIGYVFKCQSDTVADDIVGSISQAFHTCSEQKSRERAQIFSCEHCPMLWYHKLCADIEGLSDKKTQTLIFRRVELLSDEEQNIVMAKYYGAEEMAEVGVAEQNQFMMMLLRAHCESRQQRHVHDTAENRSEFLNQYLGGSTIFMKAKRSLTSSFDHLLKRKNSKDDVGLALAQQTSVTDSFGVGGRRTESERSESSATTAATATTNASSTAAATATTASALSRPRAQSIGGAAMFGRQQQPPSAEPLKSPMMDIFIKVGNSPKDSGHHNGMQKTPTSSSASATSAGSWRQEILNRVVTPSLKKHDTAAQYMSPRRTAPSAVAAAAASNATAAVTTAVVPRTADDLRQLWRTAIRQTILLRRMERENARLQERHNEHELKRIKLDYEDIIACGKQASDRWESLIGSGDGGQRVASKQDPRQLLQAIKSGVPRGKRGEIWTYLAEQHSMNSAPVDVKLFPNYNTPYKVLLKSLTEHQHAIFIDLGRTFPNHTYYKAALGIGQLSLFNILKAYSILDPELGYCQGLGFICGVLLLHCEEEEAFELLKHLMFRRQMRTKYLPDMRQFQLQLYQLSRLIRDHCPELYAWLDQNEVSPTLYAAPWILTVFSSQFALGFVTRVFDLLFLESPEVIFKVSIALLEVHKDQLMQSDGFEEIMDYLKNVVPKMDAASLELILKKIFCMDIRKQLSEYQVEYNVLQEEISNTNHHLETLKRTRENNKHLEQQLQFAQSSIVQLETTRTAQHSQLQSLQSQVQTLDVTVQALGHFITQLTERNPQLEMPGEIRRICQQIAADGAKRKKMPIFVERKIGKSMSVNSQLGFPLKVLEEMNESPGSPRADKPGGKTPFFESTYQKIRQQQQTRPQRLLDRSTSGTNGTETNGNGNGNGNGAHSHNGSETGSGTATPTTTYAAAADGGADRKMRLPEYVERAIESMHSPRQADSGISTPVSPPLSIASSSLVSLTLSPLTTQRPTTQTQSEEPAEGSQPAQTGATSQIRVPETCFVPESPSSVAVAEAPASDQADAAFHPFSNCEDVHFSFNGTTTQLKTFRPVHHVMHSNQNAAAATTSTNVKSTTTVGTDGATTSSMEGKNGRS